MQRWGGTKEWKLLSSSLGETVEMQLIGKLGLAPTEP